MSNSRAKGYVLRAVRCRGEERRERLGMPGLGKGRALLLCTVRPHLLPLLDPQPLKGSKTWGQRV